MHKENIDADFACAYKVRCMSLEVDTKAQQCPELKNNSLKL